MTEQEVMLDIREKLGRIEQKIDSHTVHCDATIAKQDDVIKCHAKKLVTHSLFQQRVKGAASVLVLIFTAVVAYFVSLIR